MVVNVEATWRQGQVRCDNIHGSVWFTKRLLDADEWHLGMKPWYAISSVSSVLLMVRTNHLKPSGSPSLTHTVRYRPMDNVVQCEHVGFVVDVAV